MTHNLGGDTGSHLETLILLKFIYIYPDQILSTFSVYPFATVSCVIGEPYNALLMSAIDTFF